MKEEAAILSLLREVCPTLQAVYLFGSFGQGDPRPGSDVDLALLLPPEEAKAAGRLYLTDLHRELLGLMGREVDLINLRQVSTVLQKEVIGYGRRIFCSDAYATDEFEMLVLSAYQKLNEERAGVLQEGQRSGRFYDL